MKADSQTMLRHGQWLLKHMYLRGESAVRPVALRFSSLGWVTQSGVAKHCHRKLDLDGRVLDSSRVLVPKAEQVCESFGGKGDEMDLADI